jgi:arylsulfatase
VTDRRRNVVLVTVDSLRADHCGFAGHDRDTTPTLDAMARDGLVFENAVAPGPSTSESVPAVFTGRYPVRRPTDGGTVDERIGRIAPHMAARDSLAERLSRRGYETAAFTPNPFTSRYFGYGAGFDHYRDFLEGSRQSLYEQFLHGTLRGSRFYMPVRVALNWVGREEAFKPWESFYDEVLAWAERASEPYFLWLFLMDVHHPYLPGAERRSLSRPALYHANWKLRHRDYEPPLGDRTHEALLTAYDDAVRYADDCLARLRTDLGGADTTFVVTADHGESFGEHGTYEHHGGAFGNAGEQEYHSYLYEENLHVPLVVAGDETTGAVGEVVSLRRLPDLVVDAATGGVDPSAHTRPYATAQTMDAGKVAVRTRTHKYIETTDGSELYDLRSDPGEREECDAPALRDGLASLAAVARQTRAESERAVDGAATVAGSGRP